MPLSNEPPKTFVYWKHPWQNMFQFTSANGIKFVWFSFLLLTFCGSLYTLYKSQKMY